MPSNTEHSDFSGFARSFLKDDCKLDVCLLAAEKAADRNVQHKSSRKSHDRLPQIHILAATDHPTRIRVNKLRYDHVQTFILVKWES